jgi:hypothetical protein
VLPAPGWKKRFISSRRLAVGAEETLTREQTRKWLVMQPLPEEGFLKGTSRDTSVALFISILSPQSEEAELRWTVTTEEGGSNSFSGEREPTIWAQINAENRLRVRQVLNPSCRRHLDLKFESHSTSRDLRDLRLLGDSPPSLWYRNLVKSNARARFHSEYRGKTSSKIAAGFPLFVKTIVGSSLCLQAQDSDSVFELKTQIHQATGTPPGFQRLTFEGRQLGDGSLLRDYGNLKKATISLTSHLCGGVPSVTHPSSYKHAVKSRTSAPLGFKDETSKVKEPFGSAFIVEQCAEPPTTEVKDPQVYGYAFIYQANALICRFNGLWPSASALREWVNKT